MQSPQYAEVSTDKVTSTEYMLKWPSRKLLIVISYALHSKHIKTFFSFSGEKFLTHNFGDKERETTFVKQNNEWKRLSVFLLLIYCLFQQKS